MESKIGNIEQRIAGMCFISGSLISGTFNAVHHHEPFSYKEPSPLFEEIARRGMTFHRVDHLLIGVGIFLLLFGFVGVFRSIDSGPGLIWARIGIIVLMVSAATWMVELAIDMGMGLAIIEWSQAVGPAKDTWFVVSAGLLRVMFSIFSLNILFQWIGAAFVGVGMIVSGKYPKSIASVIVVLGIATAGFVALPQLFIGPGGTVTNVVFPMLSGATLIWTLFIGILLLRRTHEIR